MEEEREDLLIVNGINGTTGDYAISPLPAAVVSRIARGLSVDPEHFRDLERKLES